MRGLQHRVCYKSNTTGGIYGSGIIYPSYQGTWVHFRFLVGVRVAQSLVFCVVCCSKKVDIKSRGYGTFLQ